MRYIQSMMSALPLASAHLSKLRILCVNDLLDGDLCKIYLILSHFFLFFLVFKHDFIRWLISPVSQIQTQQVMASLIRSHVEYLRQTYHILVLILQSKLVNNLALMARFDTT